MLSYIDYTISTFSTVRNLLPYAVVAFIFAWLWFFSEANMKKMFGLFFWILPIGLCIAGSFIDYQRAVTEYNSCHSEIAVKNKYVYKDGYCYRKFSGYIGVNTINVIEGEIHE